MASAELQGWKDGSDGASNDGRGPLVGGEKRAAQPTCIGTWRLERQERLVERRQPRQAHPLSLTPAP